MFTKLDLSSFAKALAAYGRSIDVSKQYLTNKTTDANLKDTIRAGVIQHFEFCFELSWKMLKRQIEREAVIVEAIDALSYPELIREGVERMLITSPKKWFVYRQQRNITSHTYNQDKASSVYATAEEFYYDAKKLYETLALRNK